MSTKRQDSTPRFSGAPRNNDDEEPTKEYQNPETLRRLYWDEGLSLPQMAERLGIATQTVANWMDKHEIPTRPSPAEKPPSVAFAGSGYLQVQSWVEGERLSFYIHKLVAVAEDGFDAVAEADLIHHRNGHKFDNRPSNLEPLSHSEHGKRHAEYDGTTETI